MRADYIQLRRLKLMNERVKKNHIVGVNHEFREVKKDLKYIIKNRKLRKKSLWKQFIFWSWCLSRRGFWKTLKYFCYLEAFYIKTCIYFYWEYKSLLMQHDEVEEILYILEERMKDDYSTNSTNSSVLAEQFKTKLASLKLSILGEEGEEVEKVEKVEKV